ncbi:hypothetical protein ABZ508_34410 [Streptomyces lavendulocolor]|uniref:Uncharacterized protein n=1 Tax=Streptomyces lavendulocolor TaxID=67316 RepID=A0ABV2WGH7_9ACTN
MPSMTRTIPHQPRGDDARGYERDATGALHRLVRHLVADGDRRAQLAGRRARRTLGEMRPGHGRSPLPTRCALPRAGR